MTIEEKIISHIEQNCTYPDGSPMMDEQTFYEGAKWGYNEAMRWRDPKEELPEGGILVQIKFDCSKYKGHPYSHDVFLSGLNRWNIEHHADIKVTGWRPIE